MSKEYTLIPNISEQIKDIPPDAILSQTVEDSPSFRTVLFTFAPGQELSEHTSTYPALIYISSGAFDVQLGADRHTVKAGAWISMQPNLAHSLTAVETSTLLLVLIKTK